MICSHSLSSRQALQGSAFQARPVTPLLGHLTVPDLFTKTALAMTGPLGFDAVVSFAADPPPTTKVSK